MAVELEKALAVTEREMGMYSVAIAVQNLIKLGTITQEQANAFEEEAEKLYQALSAGYALVPNDQNVYVVDEKFFEQNPPMLEIGKDG